MFHPVLAMQQNRIHYSQFTPPDADVTQLNRRVEATKLCLCSFLLVFFSPKLNLEDEPTVISAIM